MLAYRAAILLLISYFYGHSTPEQHGKYKIRPIMLSMSYVSHADSSMVAFANDLDINMHHVIYYHVKHSRPLHYFVPIEFKQRWQRLMVILFISGDISLNPGPV